MPLILAFVFVGRHYVVKYDLRTPVKLKSTIPVHEEAATI